MLSLHIMIYILKNLTSGLSFQGEREWEWNTTVDKYGRFHWKFEAQCIQDKQRNMFVKWKRNSVSITWCRFLCLLDFINKHYNSFLLPFFQCSEKGFFRVSKEASWCLNYCPLHGYMMIVATSKTSVNHMMTRLNSQIITSEPLSILLFFIFLFHKIYFNLYNSTKKQNVYRQNRCDKYLFGTSNISFR